MNAIEILPLTHTQANSYYLLATRWWYKIVNGFLQQRLSHFMLSELRVAKFPLTFPKFPELLVGRFPYYSRFQIYLCKCDIAKISKNVFLFCHYGVFCLDWWWKNTLESILELGCKVTTSRGLNPFWSHCRCVPDAPCWCKRNILKVRRYLINGRWN
jgi:hypothetical protein